MKSRRTYTIADITHEGAKFEAKFNGQTLSQWVEDTIEQRVTRNEMKRREVLGLATK